MRKIEQDMVESIAARESWKRDNTEVIWGADDRARVYLHGNLIAIAYPQDQPRDVRGRMLERIPNTATHVLGGHWFVIEPNIPVLIRWQTTTTRSRLRALGFGATIQDFQLCLGDRPVASLDAEELH